MLLKGLMSNDNFVSQHLKNLLNTANVVGNLSLCAKGVVSKGSINNVNSVNIYNNGKAIYSAPNFIF
jgi:hypothetical protein